MSWREILRIMSSEEEISTKCFRVLQSWMHSEDEHRSMKAVMCMFRGGIQQYFLQFIFYSRRGLRVLITDFLRHKYHIHSMRSFAFWDMMIEISLLEDLASTIMYSEGSLCACLNHASRGILESCFWIWAPVSSDKTWNTFDWCFRSST